MFIKKEMLFIFALALLVFVCYASMISHANDNNDNTNPSPDFNGNGVVDLSDFLMFAEHFGLRQGDEGYEARFDLDGDTEIGMGDFLFFVQNFGVISIPDANLRAAIETALGKTSGVSITEAEISTLTELSVPSADISDLTGLEFATNLTYLDLASNNITDISPLAGLTNLANLILSDNKITDLASLVANTSLGLGNTVDVTNNPLYAVSENTHIPALQARGVDVSFDEVTVFTSPQIYNDNIFILPVSEDLTGHLPLHDYARFFYEHFKDEFDFLIFVRNLVSGVDVDESRTPYYFNIVGNEVQGIGKGIFSNAHEWGSSGRLQGSILLVWVEFAELVWGEEWRLFKVGPILHELMHRWANYIIPSSSYAHWGFSSANGVVGGFDIANLMDHGGGQYTAGSLWGGAGPNYPAHFSPIELYLAGFIPPEEVPDLWVAENGEWLRDDQGRRIGAENGPIFTASGFKIYTIEDIIAENGPRVPDVSLSQKDFRAAVILLTDEEHPAKLNVLKRLSDDISWFCHVGTSGPTDTYHGIDRYNFYEATGGRGTITMDGLSQLQRSAGAKRLEPSSFGTPPPPIVDH